MRNEGGRSDEDKAEPTGRELGAIGPTIGELLAGWGDVWRGETRNDICNRHALSMEDRASSYALPLWYAWKEFITRQEK